MNCKEKHEFETALHKVAEEESVGSGKIIHPLRLAVSGMGEGPGVFDIVEIIGAEETLKRINSAINSIKLN